MSKFHYANYDEAHKAVESNHSLHWDGWEIVEWRKDRDAMFNKNAIYRNGSWGRVMRRIPVEDDGTWKVPAKYVMGR